MKKELFLLFFVISTFTISSQERSKFSYESGVGIAWEPIIGLPCASIHNTLNYDLSGRLFLSGNLGYFQSLNFENDFKKNASSMTVDANLNYSVFKFDNNSLIIGVGLSFLKGSLAYDDGLQSNPIHNVDYLEHLGVNALIKYRYQISDRWSGNITLKTYMQDPTVLSTSFSSVTYGWTYSF